MQKKNPTVHLLILDASQNDAEKVVSLLRNAGRATRAHRVTSLEDLEESLNSQVWDLFIAKEVDGEVTYKHCLEQIKRLEKDLPFILLTQTFDEDSALEGLKLGAREVLPVDALPRMVFSVKRELSDLEERRRRRNIEVHLREAEKRCNLLLESSMDAIAYINEGMHVFANKAYLELFGYEDIDELMCIPVMDVLSSGSQEPFKDFLKAFNDAQQNQQHKELTCTIRKSDDSEVEVVLSCSQATYDGEACTQIIVRPEVDPELEEKLRKFSSEDLLTGLYNKVHFMEHLEGAIDKALNNDLQGSLLYLELDDFSVARNEYGIPGSDSILGDFANMLKSICPDNYSLARLGDDTFAILASQVDDKGSEQLAENIRKQTEEHLFEVGDRTAQVTVSIGIARINENAPKAEELMSRAHKACSHVHNLEGKKKGNGVYLYNAVDFDAAQPLDEDMVAVLQRSLDNGRFRLLFQPIIGLRGEGEEHYEAFLRMLNDKDEEISPSEFLPIDSNAELAIKLDRWVILQNIKSLSAHRAKGHDTKLFLNITPYTVLDKTFVQWLGLALKAAKLPGGALIFQIAEENAIEYLKQAKEFAAGIKRLGGKISIGRFGCALNPFNTIKHVECDYIKMDGSFTEEIQKDERSREKLKEMITQLQELKKLTVVPFVENASVLSTLWQAGVNYIQGYYLQEPSPEMNYDFSEGE
ncbi:MULTISPECIES: EAL domain-containing response regulator [unclassified Hahella]|uniref:EAL domain-containing response regulator n=1 Tax=unclassified Hahella TaxID=2624107 RepID=UPI001C1F14E2|nr:MULTISPECIES: EAL domain-containing protein [unclassified Hahella]MBU6950068.1 EAL domain-containing protein [Hahella sp. HN01]MDG9671136.1 EAL domain-containing protein [Hahella sp. CR1]